MPKLLATIENSGSHFLVKYAIRLLAFTGVRPSELRFAQWPEFNLSAAIWEIPAERMKMRRSHTVPLSTQAITLLQQIKVINPEGYLFAELTGTRLADRRNRPMSENTLGKALRRAGYLDRQTGHGFRHLISTELNERGYNSDWIEVQLAHKISPNKIRATYNHADYLEGRRCMMQAWADLIEVNERVLDRKTG